MEKKDWRYRFIKLLYRSDYDYDISLIEEKVLEHFISQELDKAREEGFEQGYKEAKFDCEMGKEFSKESFKEVVSSVSSKLKQ